MPELDAKTLEGAAAVLKLLADGASDSSLVTPELAFAVGIVPCSECRDGHVRTDCPVCQGSGLMRVEPAR